MIFTDQRIYILENAARRLETLAATSRGTVQDDDKAYGYQLEADTIREVIDWALRNRNGK